MSTYLKNNPKYRTCVSIAQTSPKKTLTLLRRALAKSDYAEIRFDFLLPSAVPEALELVSSYLSRCVCTLRPKSEGGSFKGPETERVSILKMIAEYSPMLIDIEFNTLQRNAKLCKYIAQTKTSILVSWHNFNSTPNITILEKKFKSMLNYSKTVKIVTMASDAYDSSRVLSLYGKTHKASLIAFCMGNQGKVSRVLSLYLGAPFAYVSLEKSITKGQLSLSEMLKLLPPRSAISFK